MEIREFRSSLSAALTTRTGFEVIEQDVNKINHTEMLAISVVNPDSCISPVVYVEQLFQNYQNGSSMDEIVDSVIELIQNTPGPKSDDFVDVIRDWNQVKTMIFPKLINTEANKELLSGIPSVPFCNLSVVFFVAYKEFLGTSSGCASVTVTNILMDQYDVSVEELMGQAMQNMETAGVTVRPLVSILFEMVSEADVEGIDIPEIDEDDDLGMWVMTNSTKIFGAAAIASSKVRQQLAEQFHGVDLYVLPSSIHEMILLPCKEDMDPQELLTMVADVNSTEVADDELLATNVYLFHGDTCEVEIAA